MATLKEIKTRIHSVQNTRKITAAMKMVSMAKLHQTERKIGSIHTYYHHLHDILRVIMKDGNNYQTEFSDERELKKLALVVFSSNSNLCGSFNTNVAKHLEQELHQYSKILAKEHILIIPVGKKIAQAIIKMGYSIAPGFENLDFLIDKPEIADVQKLANQLKQLYIDKQVDSVELIYHHAKSKGSQVLESRTLLPLDLKARDVIEQPDTSSSYTEDFIIEPDRESILQQLVPCVINMRLYLSLLDSSVSEHTARMLAMQTATDNADELLEEIKLHYNKLRQQAITNELLDIVGGAME